MSQRSSHITHPSYKGNLLLNMKNCTIDQSRHLRIFGHWVVRHFVVSLISVCQTNLICTAVYILVMNVKVPSMPLICKPGDITFSTSSSLIIFNELQWFCHYWTRSLKSEDQFVSTMGATKTNTTRLAVD